MFVGGEFYNESRWQVNSPVIETGHMTFLNGGKACLMIISDYLIDHGIDRILLPSYLCPTIVNTLEKCGLTCSFYQVNEDLSIDEDDLSRNAEGYRVVFFINYFGFSRSKRELALLSELRRNGTLLVEDNAQAGFTDSAIGDFVFNSMRKLCACDGGYMTTRFDLKPYIDARRGQPNQRLPLIRQYRSLLPDYLFMGRGDRGELNLLYERAELYYESDAVVEGNLEEQRQIEHLDWPGIKQARQENYRYLASLLAEIPGITPLFPELPGGSAPSGFPVYVSGVPRDWLFDELGNAGIGLTIHWEAIRRDARLNHNVVAVEMASRMLTLVIDQRTSHKQLDYQAQTLSALIQNHRSL